MTQMIFPQRARWLSWLLRSAGALAAVAVPAGGTVHASIMIALDLPDLVRQAEHIAVVEVASVRTAWDERHERIYSTIDLKVMERWKTPAAAPSALSDRLTVVQPGGTVGDISMTVTGMGTFVVGERSLVFLRGPVTRAQVVGMTQGKRTMRYESASRQWLVSPPDLRQTKLVRSATLPVAPAASVPAAGAAPLSQVQQRPENTLVTGPRETPLDNLRVEVKRLLGAARP